MKVSIKVGDTDVQWTIPRDEWIVVGDLGLWIGKVANLRRFWEGLLGTL